MRLGKVLGFSVGPIGAAILGVIALPLTTWLFSAEDLGRIAMLQTITSLSIIVLGLGLDQCYLREYHQAQNRSALFRLVALPGLIAYLILGTLVLLNADKQFALLVFGSPEPTLTFAALLTILAAYSSRYFSLILRMEERGLAFSMSQLLPKLTFISALLLIYISNQDRVFYWLLAAHITSIVASTLIFSWNTRSVWKQAQISHVVDPLKLGKLLHYGIPLMFAGLAFWGLEAIDKVMLRYLSSFGELGLYSVAIGIASIAGTLSVIFTTIWVPTAYRWADQPDCARRVEEVGSKLVALGCLVICLTGTCTWLLEYLLPQQYESVQYLVCACMIPPILYAVAEVTGVGSGITRKSFLVMCTAIAISAFNFGANWLLIPRLGAVGATISTAIAYFILLVLRTEISIYYWAPMKRLALYGPIALITAMAVLFALIGEKNPKLATTIWAVGALYFISMNRKTIQELIKKLRVSKQLVSTEISQAASNSD